MAKNEAEIVSKLEQHRLNRRQLMQQTAIVGASSPSRRSGWRCANPLIWQPGRRFLPRRSRAACSAG